MTEKEIDKIEPREESYEMKLKEDKVFLLTMIDDPMKAFRMYGFNGDERMMVMLNSMSANIRKRAIMIFTEILGMVDATNGCNACNACRACKACMPAAIEKIDK